MTTSANVTALTPVDPATRVTPEQLTLIRNTIAQGATQAELELYLFDCQRQGVHPLDRMIYFTKRNGKYTPVTSIDFMRVRAAATGECAGIDDAVFTGTPKTDDFVATVTVWRVVQGQRCAFTASARWSEYKPASNDFMWQRMPHTMLDKCAEAKALRRGFPMQLHGLYAREELDQADDGRHGPVSATTEQPTNQSPRTILATPEQRKDLIAIGRGSGWSDAQMKSYLLAHCGTDSTAALAAAHYDQVRDAFAGAPVG